MQSLILIQEDRFENLVKSEKNYRKSPKERLTKSYVESRLESLEALWSEFKSDHKKIVSQATKDIKRDLSYFSEDLHEQFEEMYTNYKTLLKSKLDQFKSSTHTEPTGSSSHNTGSCQSDVHLPLIKLPSFSGRYDQWEAFHDLFTSIIDKNPKLKSVQKLHYLKGCLSGEPENILRNLTITDANYDEAWSLLKKRYDNKRFNCNAVLKTLFSIKSANHESPSALKLILDTALSCIKQLRNIGVDVASWDAILIYLVVSKLDTESHKQWEIQMSHLEPGEMPKWIQLEEFLEARFRALEMIGGKPKSSAQSIQPSKSFHTAVAEQQAKNISCPLCNETHYLYACMKFRALEPKERQEFVQNKRLCFNCLFSNHSVKSCKMSKSCQKCGRRHNTLIHVNKENIQGSLSATERSPLNTSTKNTESLVQPSSTSLGTEKRIISNFAKEKFQPSEVLLATALVKSKARNGCEHYIRALLDQGSQASFVTEATTQLLGLKRCPVNGSVSGLGSGELRVKYMVSFQVESRQNPENSIQVDAYVLRSFSWVLPTTNLTSPDQLEFKDLVLADPGFATPSKIDILLGAEAYSEILTDGIIKHPKGNLIAQNTIFGWIISGRTSNDTKSHCNRVINMHLQIREDQLLKQFWELETEPNNIFQKKLTKEEIKCEKIFKSTTTRDNDGRYVVKLPFKTEKPECEKGQFKELALKRFYFTEKRLLNNPMQYDQYVKVMEEYANLNHMSLIQNKEELDDPTAVYLCHHAVIREDKDTTKLRVVFNASQKGVNNVSLNNCLLTGPKLQQDLRHILMRWRCGPIAIVADIVKMYRQVKVHDDDTKYQRIIWRPDPSQPVQHYKLLRLTFGTACAPYLAVKCLQQTSKDDGHKFPIAAEKVLTDFYVDDLMTSCESIEQAQLLYKEMNALLKGAGFELQKWSSNSEEFLQHASADKSDPEAFHIKANDTLKVLGITWNRTTDNFEYIVNLEEIKDCATITKRKVLSEIAQLYDPMGWLAPVTVKAKIFIQKLWKANLDWDQQVPDDLLREWLSFREDLTNLRNVKIPRWMQLRETSQRELHAFADASGAAYAAVIYLRSVDIDGKIHVSLVTAKTKVAPIEKQVSIPRLELCGGVLAARLLLEVSQLLNIPKQNLYAWSDSAVVLAWLKGLPNRWTTFVSNRVSEIINIIDYDQWGHVTTESNPADCASRGLQPSELSNHHLWWNGPQWLQHATIKSDKPEFSTHEEEKVIKAHCAVQEIEENFVWSKYSSLSKMLRVISYCRRFLNLKLPKEKRTTFNKIVTPRELNNTLENCIKQVQTVAFDDEIKLVTSQGIVPKRSKLRNLCPILDKNGILRVGGRIQKCQVDYDVRHPIILPAKSHLSKLLIIDAHHKTMHGGPQAMLNYLRSKYWILRVREQVKKTYRTCVTCIRYSKRNTTQFMGQLPAARLRPCKPFKSAGVDYAGPINIRFSPGRGSKSYKGYICLFVCFVTRAVHLEAVTDMTTNGFLQAFRRFTARRGHCQDLHSDNGTNLVGANRQLKEMFNNAKATFPSELAELLATEGTTFHFIPPQAPNFGGLWEAGVRSTKTHLLKVIGDTTLTYEELSTVLAQIEACLNSRPITVLSDNPDDPLPLTPGHFLVGEPLINIPDEDYTQCKLSNLDRWRLTQKMVADFWNRWYKEYLVTLNHRYKWNTKAPDLEIDDIVILKEDNMPPCKWLLGKIIQKHVGSDNLTRVVTIKCKNGIYKRPISKITKLIKQDCDL